MIFSARPLPEARTARQGVGGRNAEPSERIQKEASPAALLVKAKHHRKILFSLREKEIRRAQNEKSKEYFSVVRRVVASGDGAASFVGIGLVKSSDFVQETRPSFRIRFFAKMRSVAKRRSAFWRKQRFYFFAAGIGLEPIYPGPEPSVLPLDDPAISGKLYKIKGVFTTLSFKIEGLIFQALRNLLIATKLETTPKITPTEKTRNKN